MRKKDGPHIRYSVDGESTALFVNKKRWRSIDSWAETSVGRGVMFACADRTLSIRIWMQDAKAGKLGVLPRITRLVEPRVTPTNGT